MLKPLSDADYRLLAEFRYQLRVFLTCSAEHARHAGLTPAQHQMLLAVRAFGGAHPAIGELAARLALKHHSTVELVDRLEQRGLVQRSRADEDRRFSHVRLTAQGTRVLKKLSLAHREELGRLGPELARSLLALLEPQSRIERVSATPARDARKVSSRTTRKLDAR